MMYLRCNTCPKEPCKWRAKIKLQKPQLDINSDEYMGKVRNYLKKTGKPTMIFSDF